MTVHKSLGHQKVFNAITGAVINAADAHPKWNLTRNMAQSIAKRAAGTLTAGWPEVLAACRTPPDEDRSLREYGRSQRRSFADRGVSSGQVSQLQFRHLTLIANKLGDEARKAKYAGNTERVSTIIEVLRMIAKYQKELRP